MFHARLALTALIVFELVLAFLGLGILILGMSDLIKEDHK
jgi:hypothetical protein